MIIRTKKIFVGGLSANTNLDDIKKYFEQFAKVREAMLAYDKVTNRHRGFGYIIVKRATLLFTDGINTFPSIHRFVTFDNEEVVDKICEIHFHEINGMKRQFSSNKFGCRSKKKPSFLEVDTNS